MKEVKNLVCVTCPVGCRLSVEVEGTNIISVDGNNCSRGIEYAQSEAVTPKRMLTTTVRVIGGEMPLVPVRSLEGVPKVRIMEFMDYLADQRVQAPIEREQIICELPDCGVKIIATTNIAAK